MTPISKVPKDLLDGKNQIDIEELEEQLKNLHFNKKQAFIILQNGPLLNMIEIPAGDYEYGDVLPHVSCWPWKEG